MRPSLLFFVGVDQVRFPTLSGTGERFLDQYLLTNDKTTIRTLLEPLKQLIGSVEYDFLVNISSAITYRRQHMTEVEFVDTRINLNKILVREMYNVLSFIHNLWTIKDNAACVDRGWLYINNSVSQYCHSNTVGQRMSTAKGNFERVEFSREELKQARLAKILIDDPFYEIGKATALASDTLRYQRFTYFLSGARQDVDVGLKIAQYVTALEALVSSSSAEVTHQVAERVACLLEPPSDRRIDIYKKIKQAYNYRSKVVHGASLKESEFDRLTEISQYLDEICRELSIKYVSNENGIHDHLNSNELDAFFLETLLART